MNLIISLDLKLALSGKMLSLIPLQQRTIMSETTKTVELACSLNEQELRDRRKFVRESLIPKIKRSQTMESGLRLVFENAETLRSDVELFVELESQCCGFLNFDIKATDEGLELMIDGPAEAKDILAKFTSALEKP